MNGETSLSHDLTIATRQALKPLPRVRWILLLVVLLVEVWVATYQVRIGRLAGVRNGFWVSLAELVPLVLGTIIAALAATVAFGWRGFRNSLQQNTAIVSRNAFAWPCFFGNVLAFAAYFAITAWLLEDEAIYPGWILAWALMGVAAFTFLGMSVLPAKLWLQLARDGWALCLAGFCVGAGAIFLGRFTISWGRLLNDCTFSLVQFLLEFVARDVVCEPHEFLIGTADYLVIIGPPCSGYEGIGLVWVFLAAYFWLCRNSLRFPQALLLVPLGTALIWLTNGLRITALILMGTHWSAAVAERGFHSQAGWLAFNAVSLALVVVSNRLGFFRRDDLADRRADHVNPAAAYLVPFVVLMAVLMVGAGLSATGFDYFYPFRMVAVAAALGWFWRVYARWSWSWSWPAVGLGVVVFMVWLVLELTLIGQATDGHYRQALGNMPSGLAAAWVVLRILGSVLTVPFAEELAFRGFLLRRLQKVAFEDVSPQNFTWISFLVSSVLFGLLHERWLAGTMAGMIYAIALYRRGKVTDAILAHATTNALIAVYVLASGAWSMWG